MQATADVRLRAVKARRLGAQAHELMRTGKFADCLERSEEAVAQWRTLASEEPQFRPDLAKSLGDLSVRAQRVGQVAEALAAATESANLWRSLTDQDLERHGFGLFEALVRLAPQTATFHWKELFTLREEAARLLVLRLLPLDEERYLLRAAEACLWLAEMGAKFGEPTKALRYAEKSVELWRRLADQDLLTHGPRLVRALKRLSWEQIDGQGRFSRAPRWEARRVLFAQQLLRFGRVICIANPKKFRPFIAAGKRKGLFDR